jgi:gamma-resorcylate decarboxylase
MSEHGTGKIALEEHFYLPSFEAYGADGSALDGASKAHNYDQKYFATVQQRLTDVNSWIEDMDRGGIERMVLSLTQPGIQGIPDRKIAVDTAKRMNDDLAQIVAANPKRFSGFAAVPLQDVRAARDELERAVSQLSFKGVLINGYTNIGDANAAQYLDEKPVWDFWAGVEALGVPVYLHPRPPLPNQRRVYAAGRIPAAAHERGGPGQAAKARHFLSSREFLCDHRRHFRSQPLLDTLLEIGADRLLFSVDYPYETVQEQVAWFDNLAISETDRRRRSSHRRTW